MNGWEQELHIYHLESAPIRETNLENYITKYLATKDNKYLELFYTTMSQGLMTRLET